MSPLPGTSHATLLPDGAYSHLIDQLGLVLLASGAGAPTATADTYARGATYLKNDGSSGQAIYTNEGTSAAPSWVLAGATATSEISLTTNSILVGAAGVASAVPLATKGLRATVVAGGAAGDITVTGIAVGDLLVLVARLNRDGTAATIDLSDITSEFTVAAAKINNAAGTNTTGDALLVLWWDLT